MGEAQDLAVQHRGQGFPVLIVHGWTMTGAVEASDFEPVFAKKPGYRRIYLDLPGMGSTPAGGITDLDSILDRVSAFIEKHVLPSNFLVIGTSCGAYLAMAIAYKYSSTIDGLLLRVPLVEPETSQRDVDPFLPAVTDSTLISSLSDAARQQLDGIPVLTAEYVDAHRRKTETTWLPAIAAADAKLLDPIRNDPKRYRLTAAMHSPATPLFSPALILTGRQDTVVGYRDAWPLVKCYPRATFVALDRADHGLPVDEMALFEALVNDWLSRVEESQRVQAAA